MNPRPATDVRVRVASRIPLEPRERRALIRAARFAASGLGFRVGELSIVVVGACAMRSLHSRYLGDPTVTDVITFDLGTERRAKLLLGEIYVCRDVARQIARRQRRIGGANTASRMSRAYLAELVLYAVHGILHLAGFDDHERSAFAAMHRREAELMSQLGYAKSFREILIDQSNPS